MDFPSLDAAPALIREYARFVATFQADLQSATLVLPTGEYFPDAFSPDRAGAQRVLARMQHHAGVGDIPIRVELLSDELAPASSCDSGGCGAAPVAGKASALVDSGDAWVLGLDPSVLRHPVLLTTILAQNIGRIFIEETRPPDWHLPVQGGLQVELAGCALGLGVLLLEGSYVYQKSCGGPQVQRFTASTPEALALATTLFALQHGLKLKTARRRASTTQAALLSSGEAFLAANDDLGRALAQAPLAVADGHFTLRERPAGFLSRFGRSTKSMEPPALMNTHPRGPSAPQREDGLAELVADAFSK